MSRLHTSHRAAPLAAALLLFPAAASAAPRMAAAATDSLVPITVRFAATVGDTPFTCGTSYPGVGTTRAAITASDFRFYVHGVRLVTAAGDTVAAALRPEAPWQDADVALLDFENGQASCANGTPELRDHVTVLAPAGSYRGVAFTLGVPFSRNHGELAQQAPPLSLSRLFWSWAGGYKFLRVDLRATAGDSAATPWMIHLGSTGCTPAPGAQSPTRCGHPNRATVALAGFNPARDVVVADLGALLARADVRANQPKTAAGCMAADNDADCGALFASLRLPHSATTGADTPAFFRVVPGGAAGAATGH
ncbi:MAG: hypothetical protein RLZ32_1435 [Gemmatimonadota bacterium]